MSKIKIIMELIEKGIRTEGVKSLTKFLKENTQATVMNLSGKQTNN